MESFSKFDILILGLIVIPIIIYSSASIQSKVEKMVSNKGFHWFTPLLSVGLIYNYSLESNILGLFGLTVGFLLFFMFYAAGVSLIVKEKVGHK